MVDESSRLPRHDLRPLFSSFSQSFTSNATATTESNGKYTSSTHRTTPRIKLNKRRRNYLSKIMRLSLIGDDSSSGLAGTGILSSSTINSNTVAINSIDSAKTIVEYLIPRCRLPPNFPILHKQSGSIQRERVKFSTMSIHLNRLGNFWEGWILNGELVHAIAMGKKKKKFKGGVKTQNCTTYITWRSRYGRGIFVRVNTSSVGSTAPSFR